MPPPLVIKVRKVVTSRRWREADVPRNGCMGLLSTGGGGLFLNLDGGLSMFILLLK